MINKLKGTCRIPRTYCLCGNMGGNHFSGRFFTLFLFIALLLTATPVSAADHTLNPGDSIMNAIAGANTDDTLILNPGTYPENNIRISKDISIKANESAGGTAANTIIDATSSGRIFNSSEGYSFALEELTLQNGNHDDGGGIYSSGGTVLVSSCTFVNCTAAKGGAINSSGSTILLASSDFISCSATLRGGAIFSYGDDFTATSCTFTDCSALREGGAVFLDNGDNIAVTSCIFSGCDAESGGAIYSIRSTIILASSDFTGCSAYYYGGAIGVDISNITATSCTFTGCSADRVGGAIIIAGDSAIFNMNFSRIVNCNTGTAIYNNDDGIVNVRNNWWGTNDNPYDVYTFGTITVEPWLVLRATAASSSITTAQTLAVSADLMHNSAGEDKSGSGCVPGGIPVAFSALGGSVMPSVGNIFAGYNASVFTPASAGAATIYAIIDGVTVSVPLTVSTPVTVGSSSGSGSNTNTGIGMSANLKAGSITSFDMEKGAVNRLLVTAGTDIRKLMITVKSLTSLPSSIDEPDTDVYEYEDVTIYYAENSDLSGGTFEFKVSKSWLSSHGYGSGDIVMMHYNEESGEWENLLTTLTGEDGSYYYYNAETPSFSWFAVGILKNAAIMPEVAQTSAAAQTSGVAESVVPAGEIKPVDTASSEASSQQAALPPEEKSESSINSLILPGLLAFLIIAIIAAVVVRKRNDKYPDWWNKKD